ncbi:MAG TPA: glutathione S-transferase family protein [Ideonella sp.]|nr:glutathione S-transferase family protein [Ideonella sp.]
MKPPLTLVSHALCPYVQRAAIVLAEKGVAFERRDVDLSNKPDWFLTVSPLGKTPVLLVGDEALFESAVICEYLDETRAPRLHPVDPLERARHRGWIEFGSALLNLIAAFYNAPDEAQLLRRAQDIRTRLERLETVLGDGPFFSGARFSVVDAVFGPVFRYFEVFDRIADFGFFDGFARLQAWRAALAARPSVRGAVSERYAELLTAFLLARGSALSRRMQVRPALPPSMPPARVPA